ncbi:hypothetical protein C0966_08300 [Bacillus methanolicus]|nr:hypothetical protein [Bacillus methanolicus]
MHNGSRNNVWTYTFSKQLHANDDILSAVKGVQDLKSFLDGIKAQLGSAIRAKGGTMNDTDPFSAFVSAVNGIPLGKKWASGTATTSGSSTVTISGLSFRPSVILVARYAGGHSNYFQAGIIDNKIRNGTGFDTFNITNGSLFNSTNSQINSNGGVVETTGWGTGQNVYWLAYE